MIYKHWPATDGVHAKRIKLAKKISESENFNINLKSFSIGLLHLADEKWLSVLIQCSQKAPVVKHFSSWPFCFV